MTIKKIKDKLLKWRDFYGQDIADIESIENAKTKKELKKVLCEHGDWLEDQNNDALRNLDNFMAELGLTFVD